MLMPEHATPKGGVAVTDRNVVIRLRGEIGDFQAKMVTAGKSVGNVADKMTGAEKESQKFRRGLDSLGKAGGAIGLAAAAGVAVAVKAFADFDQAMSSVAAATHATRQEMEQLRGLALQTGADTAFSAVEAADGIEQLAKAGVTTADIMGGGLQGALDLAAAGTIAVGDAAETAATAMTQFGLSGGQVPHIADLLAAAAGKAQGEVGDMSMALKQSGLVADQVGLTIEETTGALASFASAGLLGSDAGTSFKTMLMRLLPSTKEAGDAMEAIGFNAFDANGNMKDLTEIAGGLQKGLSKMTAEQRQATLQTIFGQDAIRAATVLYEQGADGIQSWIDKVNDQGYAAETAAIKMDNLAGDTEKLKGALSTLFIESGSAGNDFLRGATQNAEGFVNALAEMPKWATDGALALGAITAVLGGGLWFTSKVVGGITDTREALKNLGVTAEMSKAAMLNVAKAAGVLGAAVAADLLADLGDTDYTLQQINRQLLIMGQTGSASDVFKDLSFGVKDLGDALHAGVYDDAVKLAGWFGADYGVAGELKELDQALADMDASAAKAAFEVILREGKQAGLTVDQLKDLFPKYRDELELSALETRDFGVAQRSASRSLDETGGPAGRAADGIRGVGRAAGDAGEEIDQLDVAIGDLEVTLNARQKNRAYEQSLDDLAARMKERRDLIRDLGEAQSELANAGTTDERNAANDRIADLKDQLKDYALTLDDNKQAGREWNTMLEDMASNALNAGLQLEGMDRVRYLNNARRDFIDMATKITGSREKAKKLADDLELLHQKKVKPTIDVDTEDAEADVRKFNRMLENLKPRTVKLFLETVMGKNDTGEKGDPRFDKGFAEGGFTGNYPVNNIAGVVHGREFVMDADLTSRYRPLFEAIHRSRRVPGYREGGYVAAQSSTTNYYGGTEIDYDRLAAAMSKARPLYGPVHVRDGSDFLRTLEQDQRREAIGGANFRG